MNFQCFYGIFGTLVGFEQGIEDDGDDAEKPVARQARPNNWPFIDIKLIKQSDRGKKIHLLFSNLLGNLI